MVNMEMHYSQDKLIEIWERIDTLHLSYLEMEESNEKLEYRNKLEDCIRNFLCIAKHEQKFFFRETAEVFYRSASKKTDFNAYEATIGWNSLQIYAGNLLSQPWRKEYRQIKTYSGFYKHQIEANLIGAEIMFEAMGYKHCGEGIMILDGPICPDTVTNISKDCLIAYVECQILKTIFKEVSTNYNITWMDIIQFRKDHSGNPEQTIRSLIYHKQYGEMSKNYSDGCCINNQNNYRHTLLTTSTTNSMAYGNRTPYMYGCSNNYFNYTPHSYYTLPCNVSTPVPAPPSQIPSPSQQALLRHSNGLYHPSIIGITNGHILHNHHQQQPPQKLVYNYNGIIPTAQLIEVNSNSYDEIDRITNKSKSKDKSIDSKLTKSKDDKNEASQLENWDYVYNKLETQGYNKDLGERGDILKQKKSKSLNIDDPIINLPSSINDRPLKITEALGHYDKDINNLLNKFGSTSISSNNNHSGGDINNHRHSRHSSYENLSPTNDKKLKTTKDTIQKEKKKPNTTITPIIYKEIINKMDSGNDKKNVKKDSWDCKYCTYINNSNENICEICNKSRNLVDLQMEIGGPECSQCTLVNPRNVDVCQVCKKNLQGSPTYI